MEGITTAIVGFFLLCVAFPKMVKHKNQFYIAFIMILAMIVLQSIAAMGDPNGSFKHFTIAIAGLLQIMVLILFVLSCGGLSVGELSGEIGGAYEVIRRGETEKEVIIPLTGEQPRARQDRR